MPMNYGAARAASKKRKLAHEVLAAAAATEALGSDLAGSDEGKETVGATVDSSNPHSHTLGKSKSQRKEIGGIIKKRRTEKLVDLPWKSIVLPSEIGFDEEGGLLELDEVEGVDVVYGDGVVSFQVPDIEPKLEKNQLKKRNSKSPGTHIESEDKVEPELLKNSSMFPDEDLDALQAAMDEEYHVENNDNDDDLYDEEGFPLSASLLVRNEKEKTKKKDFEGVKKEEKENTKKQNGKNVEVIKAKLRNNKEKKGKNDESNGLAKVDEEDDFQVGELLPAWSHLTLPNALYRALHELKFETPTAIQERALSVEIGAKPFHHDGWEEEEMTSTASDEDEEEQKTGDDDDEEEDGKNEKINSKAKRNEKTESFISAFPEEEEDDEFAVGGSNLRDRDLVGVAQTGSGKTLAYGLPILSHILKNFHHPVSISQKPQKQGEEEEENEDWEGEVREVTEVETSSEFKTATRLSALILAPTRELALQVRSAISEVAQRTNKLLPDQLQDPNINAPRKRERQYHISVVALTGGMSIEKQKRQLKRGADILVATPGRLWDLLGEDDELAKEIKGIKFLVIDEADRMIENGHFAELENIVKLTRRKMEGEDDETYEADFGPANKGSRERHSTLDRMPARNDMRTFVFSATMSKGLQMNLKKKNRKFKPGQPEDGMSSLDDLLLKLDFRDPDPELIDLSPEGGLVETLKECKIECLLPDKDVHLYHFLLRYPGRTIVFLSSIDGIRRLHPLLVLLGLDVFALHSGMQQRARLKSLDRFKASPTAVLLATDVAARGLDIPSVSHVVHYQLPRSADVYVHRSGRTARAGQDGLALQLCSPEEKQMQRLLMASLGKGVDLPELPTDFSILDKLKERLELAKKLEVTMHKATKEAHEDNWFKQTAAAMEIDIDSDMGISDVEESGRKKSRKELRSKAAKVTELRSQLQALLKKPLMMRGVSAKYLTTRSTVGTVGGKLGLEMGFVDQLVSGTGHKTILGVETRTALEDVPRTKQKPKSTATVRSAKVDD